MEIPRSPRLLFWVAFTLFLYGINGASTSVESYLSTHGVQFLCAGNLTASSQCMQATQREMSRQIKDMQRGLKVSGKQLNEIEHSSTNLVSDISELQHSINDIQKAFMGEEFADPEYHRQITELTRRVEGLRGKTKNSYLDLLKAMQTTMSNTARVLWNDLDDLTARMRRLTDRTAEYNTIIDTEERSGVVLRHTVTELNKLIHRRETEVALLKNPQSPGNMDKINKLRELTADKESLEKFYMSSNDNILHARSELRALQGEMSNARTRAFKDDMAIIAMEQESTRLKKTVTDLLAYESTLNQGIHSLDSEMNGLVELEDDVSYKQMDLAGHLKTKQEEVADFQRQLDNEQGIAESVREEMKMAKLIPRMVNMKNSIDNIQNNITSINKGIRVLERKLAKSAIKGFNVPIVHTDKKKKTGSGTALTDVDVEKLDKILRKEDNDKKLKELLNTWTKKVNKGATETVVEVTK